MRIPHSFRDRSLLEDEPFASQFLVRSCASESRSRSNRFNLGEWIESLIDAVKHDGLCAAHAWLSFAFSACDDEKITVENQTMPTDANIRIFIQFYWTLFEMSDMPEKDQAALRFLEQERTTRGYCYILDGRTEVTRPQRLRQPTNKGVKRSRRSYKRPRKLCGDDAYDAEASACEEELISRSPGNAPSTQEDSRPQDNVSDVPQPEQVHLRETVGHAPSVHIEQREDQEDVVLGSKRKADSDDVSSPTQLSAAEDTGCLVTPLRGRDTAMDEDDATLSPLTDLSDSEPEMKDQTNVVASADTTRIDLNLYGRPRRAASQRERLAERIEDMNKFENECHRGLIGCDEKDDSDADVQGSLRPQLGRRTTPLAPQLAMRSTPLPKRPKQRKQKKSGKAGPLVEVHAVQCKAGPDSSIAASLGSGSNPASCPTGASAAVATPKQTTAKKPSKYARKNSLGRIGGDLPSRLRKRPRKDKGSTAEVVRGDPLEGHAEHTRIANSPSEGRPQEQSVSLAVTEGQSTSSSTSPIVPPCADQPVAPRSSKRSRTAFEDTASSRRDKTHNQSGRQVAPLPKRKRKRSAAIEAPRPSRSDLHRQPSCLADVDSVVRDAASDALFESTMQNSGASPSLTNWMAENDGNGEEIPPDSDDEVPLRELVSIKRDEEADIPLAHVVTSKSPYCAESDGRPRQPGSLPQLPLAQPLLQDSTHVACAPKPRLRVRPPIWAESRQEVCESFEWFRSYQGGVYFLKDMVKGYLLGGFAASRDIFAHDGRLIISHGGGKAESIHTQKGVHKSHKASDQLEVDDKYNLFPYNLGVDGYTYVVLGFYRIAHAWAEEQPAQNAQGSVVRYKFAFQWCEEQGMPWWAAPKSLPPELSCETHASAANGEATTVPPLMPAVPASSEACVPNSLYTLETSEPSEHNIKPSSSSESGGDGPVHTTCSTCHQTSPMVYAEQWMCLHRKCPVFWRNVQGHAPAKLTYAESFLQPVTFAPESLQDLRPQLPAVEAEDGITTTSMFCKGWHCRQCGRLSSRYMWEHWQCKHCGEAHKVPGRVRDPKEFWSQAKPQTFLNHIVAPDSGIISVPTRICKIGLGWGQCNTYILPYNRGRIHLICSDTRSKQPASAAFQDYQMQAANGELLFRRWPLRAHKCRGTLLTNYFSQNSGEPYQYVGGTDNTVPWDRAPSAVRDALELIRIRMKEALNMDANFNEVLSAAYMERQKMAFHSDAERGLGPVIASLSLGSGAYMYFRLLGRHSDKKGQGGDRNALTFYLRHGDVVVMEGADVQTYYEHTVVPVNFRIAATARSIDNRNH